ncbi:MAG: ABC transporter permease subunit, partial [Myxococcales bacterium]|nr:ABC transporter permease subunit [Myxococcales bacterium]
TILFLELLPMLLLGWASLLPFYQAPSFAVLDSVTLKNFFRILRSSQIRDSIGNTIILVLAAPTFAVTLAFFASWFSVRRKMKWVEGFAMAPMAIPNVVLALALLLVYIRTPIYGSIWILVIAHGIAWLAYVSRITSASLLQLHLELEEAAQMSGASTTGVIRTIVVPLILAGLINAWLYVVSHTAKDFTFAIFLMSSSNMVVTAAMWTLWNVPDIAGTAALGMLFMIGFLPIVLVGRYFITRESLI